MVVKVPVQIKAKITFTIPVVEDLIILLENSHEVVCMYYSA